MPNITLENGTIVEGFPDNPTSEDLAKLDRIKKKYQTKFQPISQQPSPPPEVSLTESALRGGAQGVSFGFPDEATARLESITKGVPYEQALQESRDAYKRAQEANPITYTLSEIAGGVLPAFVPGGVIAKAGQLVSKIPLAGRAIQSLSAMSPLAKGVALGGTTGAVTGLGMSEGQDIGEIVRDIAIGGALGGGLPVIGRGIARATQSLKPLADEAIKTSTTGFTGKTRAFLDQLDKNPEQVKRIEEKFAGDLQSEVLPEISMKIDRFVERNPFAKRAKANSRLSVEKIPENIRVSKQPAIQEIDKVLDVLKKDTVTDTSREAQKILSDYRSRIINELNPSGTETPSIDIPGRDLKVFLQNIGDDIEKHGGYGNPFKNTKVGQTLKNVRRSLDQELKDKAPDYKEIMKKVNNDTVASVKLTRQFMSKEGVPDSGKINTFINRTTQKPQLMEIDRPTKRAVELLQQDRPLQTLGQDIQDINLKKIIESRGNQGSNITNPVALGMGGLGLGIGSALGGGVGAGIGGGIGSFMGGIAARQLEQRGGKIAESVLRKTKNIRTPTEIPQSTQRGFATQQGAQRGLLDQFLSDNRPEVERRQAMKSKIEQDFPNRVKSK